MIYKYGEKQFNLLEVLGETEQFLLKQNKQMEAEKEVDNPINIPELSKEIKPEFTKLLAKYRENIGQRVEKYKSHIETIEKEIEKAYKEINSTPYNLYSLLIHEGSADSGHYYSYLFDRQEKKWRKYNDLNITEEVEEQVLKEGKGINATSAYYLVYAQGDVLIPADMQGPKLTYFLSNEEQYLKNHYATYLKPEQKNSVVTDNNHLYFEIEQHKMNQFATRVVDAYAKKFETFN